MVMLGSDALPFFPLELVSGLGVAVGVGVASFPPPPPFPPFGLPPLPAIAGAATARTTTVMSSVMKRMSGSPFGFPGGQRRPPVERAVGLLSDQASEMLDRPLDPRAQASDEGSCQPAQGALHWRSPL